MYRIKNIGVKIWKHGEQVLLFELEVKIKFMNSTGLRSLQAPLKEKYKTDPASAMIT